MVLYLKEKHFWYKYFYFENDFQKYRGFVNNFISAKVVKCTTVYKLCGCSRSWRWSKFTLHDFEGMKEQRKVIGWNIYMVPYMVEVDNVSWSTWYDVRPIQKKWVLHKTRDFGNQLDRHWFPRSYWVMVGSWTPNMYCGPSTWSTFTFNTLSLRAHIQSPNKTSTSHKMALDVFQQPLDFHGHNSWSIYEVAMSTLLHSRNYVIYNSMG